MIRNASRVRLLNFKETLKYKITCKTWRHASKFRKFNYEVLYVPIDAIIKVVYYESERI